MADRTQRLSHNAPGDFFVDRTCIDCDQCREIAPETFRDGGSEATVYRQPDSPEALRCALMALVTCPVGAIGTEQRHDVSSVVSAFPVPIEDNVYFCGFASSASFGASSYLIVRPEGNVLMDSPRFASRLAAKIEQMGGIRWMFLSHVDDMADHARFRRHFSCDRILHRREIHSRIADIEWQIEGNAPQPLAPDLLAIPTPGHTRGHMVLLYRERFLFTGDHLWWSPERQQLTASRRHCWYSWSEQMESMERLLPYCFEWVLPGHGRRHHASPEQMQQSLVRCIAQMQRR
ncbi:MAG: MBL fold metallo-hydrolase [Acidobacteria bacterium]|nr:MBL fold metallo-hydrolase [Acidobacteriota bacterium]